MPSRYFRPKGGFFDARDSKLRLDEDGTTTRVLADGTERPEGMRNNRAHFVPAWSKSELETLVAAGKWEELAAPEQADPIIADDKEQSGEAVEEHAEH